MVPTPATDESEQSPVRKPSIALHAAQAVSASTRGAALSGGEYRVGALAARRHSRRQLAHCCSAFFFCSGAWPPRARAHGEREVDVRFIFDPALLRPTRRQRTAIFVSSCFGG